MQSKIRRILGAGVLGVSLVVSGSHTTFVHAEPTSQELEKKTDDLHEEVGQLESQLNSLASEIETITSDIEESKEKMKDLASDLDSTQKKGEEQYEAMKLRIKYIYESGDSTFIELLCSSKSMADFLNKTEFVKTVSQYDRDKLNELLDTQDEITEQGEELEEEQNRLFSMQDELNDKKALIESQLSSSSADLEKYEGLLKEIKYAESLLQKPAEPEPVPELPKPQPESPKAPEPTPEAPKPSEPETPQSSSGEKVPLGRFKITHYCPCYICTGGWGNNTASGTRPTAGRTIAVDRKVIPLGSKVEINGHVYIAEDTGGAIRGNKIDIFVNDHATALAYGVYYTDVYLIK